MKKIKVSDSWTTDDKMIKPHFPHLGAKRSQLCKVLWQWDKYNVGKSLVYFWTGLAQPYITGQHSIRIVEFVNQMQTVKWNEMKSEWTSNWKSVKYARETNDLKQSFHLLPTSRIQAGHSSILELCAMTQYDSAERQMCVKMSKPLNS